MTASRRISNVMLRAASSGFGFDTCAVTVTLGHSLTPLQGAFLFGNVTLHPDSALKLFEGLGMDAALTLFPRFLSGSLDTQRKSRFKIKSCL